MIRIMREIGIDMGHRVSLHGSKCRNVHGHRYRIQAEIEGKLAQGGEQDGMVLDFGFLKNDMLTFIDARCDHKLCLWVKDPLASFLFGPLYREAEQGVKFTGWFSEFIDHVGAVILIPSTPTAENLAELWFKWLRPSILEQCRGRGALHSVTVWETPNCKATFTG